MSLLPADIKAGFLSDPADITRLQIIDPAKLSALGDELAVLSPDTAEDTRKRFVVLATGGTLSMSDEGGIRKPDLDLTGILQRVDAGLQKRFDLRGLDAFKIDSAQMDYRHVQDLAIALCYLWQRAVDKIHGFLILHGTDTLSYSGAALSLMMGQGLPFSVVYTAAQKPIQAPMNDAAGNIRHALYTLEALHANDMAEVVSVMGSKAYLSSAAIKIHDLSREALTAPLHPPVADFTMLDYPVKLAGYLKPRRRAVPFQPTIWQGAFGHSLIVRSRLGLPPHLITRQLEDPHVQSVILYSYGAGSAYNGIIDAVMDGAHARDLPVFVISPVNTHYKVVYESAQTLIERGATPLYMTLPAALAKMEIALRLHAGDNKAMASFMQNSYVGEVPAHV